MKPIPLLGTTAALGLFCVNPLAAQEPEPSKSDLEQRIEQLEEQLRSLDEEVEYIQLGGELAMPAGNNGQAGLAPAASKIYRTESGLSIGGYGEMLYTNVLGEDGNELDLYRAILYFGYRFNENWLFNAEIEWEHVGETAVEFAYLEYQSSEAANYRFGHMLVPMGIINQLHEPTTFLSPNRPLVERFILPSTWHENGVAFYGTEGDFDYHVAIMNGFYSDFELDKSGLRKGRQKGSQASADDLAAILRLDYTGCDDFWFGGSVYMGDSGQTNTTSDFSTMVYEVHAQFNSGPWVARALYAAASVDDAALLPNATAETGEDLMGYYAEVGYDVFANNGGEASLTPFLRYAAYDLAEDTATDSEVTRIMLGLAWQPIPQLIFKGALTQEEMGSEDDNILELSTGYVF